MNAIWKYPLLGAVTRLEVPIGGTCLCVQNQNDIPTTWWLIDDSAKPETRQVAIYATGERFYKSPDSQYIGTFQTKTDLGNLVFHAFLV
jgi:hypothetical protein